MRRLRVHQIPLFEDNYCYLLPISKTLNFLVDPADPQAVFSHLQKNHPSLLISHILLTHKHHDHTGPIPELLQKLNNPDIQIFSGRKDSFPFVTNPMGEPTTFHFEDNLHLLVQPTPCHTKGHVCYHFSQKEESLIFTGDTLFQSGCGRFFEGDAHQMLENMHFFHTLPQDCLVYCGHEYTVQNLTWANKVLNEKGLQERLAWAKNEREKGNSTIPSSIGQEITFNLFMRCGELQQKFHLKNEVEVMQVLRDMKNKNMGWEEYHTKL